MKRIAIIQSAYIPWKGFFDLVGRCDEYVVLDSAQYEKRHWHNRNRIKTQHGLQWLTIPVVTKSRFTQPIDAVEIAEAWAESHWRAIELAYRRAPAFSTHAPRIRALYERAGGERRLTDVNAIMLHGLFDMIGLHLQVTHDRVYGPAAGRSERLLDICRKAGAGIYLSGPSARNYLDVALFAREGIEVEWMEYGPYAEYPQLHGAFEHHVSIIDVILHAGDGARALTKSLAILRTP